MYNRKLCSASITWDLSGQSETLFTNTKHHNSAKPCVTIEVSVDNDSLAGWRNWMQSLVSTMNSHLHHVSEQTLTMCMCTCDILMAVFKRSKGTCTDLSSCMNVLLQSTHIRLHIFLSMQSHMKLVQKNFRPVSLFIVLGLVLCLHNVLWDASYPNKFQQH